MDRYAVAHVDEIGELDDGRAPMRAVRHHFGITSFGVNAWTGREAGARIINEHDEGEPDSDEELYLVLRGRASFEVDGEQFDAPAGTSSSCGPASNVQRSETKPTRRSSWWAAFPGNRTKLEVGSCSRPSRPLYEAGDYPAAAARGRELFAGDPPYANLFYNVACCESLAGEKDQAIAHLRRAIELSEGTRSFLDGDFDLDPLRQDPAFKELLAG